MKQLLNMIQMLFYLLARLEDVQLSLLKELELILMIAVFLIMLGNRLLMNLFLKMDLQLIFLICQ